MPTAQHALAILIGAFVLDSFRQPGARMNLPLVGRMFTFPIAGPAGPGLVESLLGGGA